MSLHDQKEFLKSIHPFDILSDSEIELSVKNIEITYYPKDTTLISPKKLPESLFFIIKGIVNELNDEDSIVREYHERDFFDENCILYEKSEHRFVVVEDVICYELSKKGFLTLFESNKEFKNFFLLDLAQKIQLLRKKSGGDDMGDFMTAKVKDAYLHKPCLVDKNSTLKSAVKKSINEKSSSIVVEKDGSYGIVTDSDLKKYLLFGLHHLNTEVKYAANFPMICVDDDEYLFNALFIFTKHGIKRVGVLRDKKLIGILEQIDLLSFFANQTHLTVVKMENATTVDELKGASLDYINVVKALSSKNVSFKYISKLISQINTNIFKKLFELVVPVELRDKCSFVVMGSEGREEQVIRTDQDNALIIKDGVDKEKFYPYAKEITKALLEFGYPKCDGNVMVSNSYWCKNVSEYKKELDNWIYNPSEESFVNFSIFFDARFVAGESIYLESVKDEIFKKFDSKNDIYLAHFAKLTLLFDTPVGFFSSIFHRDKNLDIKKAAIFPIVQGVRALSLKFGIRENSTISRIEELNRRDILKDDQANELMEAFEIASSIRLESALKQLEDGKKPTNIVEVDSLSKIKRDLLKDSLQIVNSFKKFVSHHFLIEKIS